MKLPRYIMVLIRGNFGKECWRKVFQSIALFPVHFLIPLNVAFLVDV